MERELGFRCVEMREAATQLPSGRSRCYAEPRYLRVGGAHPRSRQGMKGRFAIGSEPFYACLSDLALPALPRREVFLRITFI
jgi:hypothetical protein